MAQNKFAYWQIRFAYEDKVKHIPVKRGRKDTKHRETGKPEVDGEKRSVLHVS